MKLIRKLLPRLDKNGHLQSWAEFLCEALKCGKIVERRLDNGRVAKSCGCKTKELQSESKRGKRNHMFSKTISEETRKKQSEAKKGKTGSNKGKKMSEKQKQKLSKINKGKILTEEHKQKIKENHKGMQGQRHSEETRKKQSEAHKGKIGQKAGNWQGGKSFEIYPQEFNKKLKQQILERDNYICQYPGCIEIHDRLNIHHIDYDKKNNNPENLITLGTSCHLKTNGNRQYWTEFYKSFMINRNIECLL